MNTFIALSLPEAASQAIQNAMRTYQTAIPVPVSKQRWHCTILFLGDCEIPDSAREELFKPLRQKFHPSITILSLGEHVPTQQLWAYVQQSPAIAQLRHELIDRVRACGIAIPVSELAREFIPHINLGKIVRTDAIALSDVPVKTLFSPKELRVLTSNPALTEEPYEQLGIIPLTP